jgi:acyl-CoA dehydrogenase
MDFDLPYELKLMKEQLRHFVDTEIIPFEREAYSGPSLKPEVKARLQTTAKEMGLWLIDTPPEYGGLGLSLLARVIIWEEMGRTIAFPARKAHVFGPEISPILFHLNEEQKKDYLYPVIAGEKIACFAQTEPDAGSDPTMMRSTAVRDGDYYTLNGYKRFITNAQDADFVQVFAYTDRSKGGRGISAFLVDMDQPGVKITRIMKTIMDDEPCEIAFDNVKVPAWKRIGEEGQGFKLAQEWLTVGRIRHGARALGVIERCLEMSARYAKQRVTFGQPLSERQTIQWMLVDSYQDVVQLRLLIHQAAWKFDRGEDARYEAYIAKNLGNRLSFRAADNAMQIHGGIAFTPELPIEKFWRDQRSMMISDGPEEVLKVALARHVLQRYGGK